MPLSPTGGSADGCRQVAQEMDAGGLQRSEQDAGEPPALNCLRWSDGAGAGRQRRRTEEGDADSGTSPGHRRSDDKREHSRREEADSRRNRADVEPLQGHS